MRKLSYTLFILIAAFSFSYPLALAQDVIQASIPLPKQGKVLFLGNSITYAGQYIQQFSTALLLKDPNHGLEILNLGLPSETVSGLSEEGHAGGEFPRPNLHDRLGRILDQLSPDLVIACYGINDGIYLPLNFNFEKPVYAQYVNLKRKPLLI